MEITKPTCFLITENSVYKVNDDDSLSFCDDLTELSLQIIHSAISAYQSLGPDLLENPYRKCMVIELKDMGLELDSELERVLRLCYGIENSVSSMRETLGKKK
jgi:hypothetical protein